MQAQEVDVARRQPPATPSASLLNRAQQSNSIWRNPEAESPLGSERTRLASLYIDHVVSRQMAAQHIAEQPLAIRKPLGGVVLMLS